MGYKHSLAEDLLSFETEKGLIIPEDLRVHFLAINRINDDYNEHLYCFYSILRFKSVDKELVFWNGTPDYSNIVNTLDNCNNCFVFADYMFHSCVYAIRLSKEITPKNEVYVISGDKFKIIAESFTDFMKLYEDQSDEIQI